VLVWTLRFFFVLNNYDKKLISKKQPWKRPHAFALFSTGVLPIPTPPDLHLDQSFPSHLSNISIILKTRRVRVGGSVYYLQLSLSPTPISKIPLITIENNWSRNVFDHYRKGLTNLSKSTTISKTSLIIIENS
jgi:hypothetical protein